MATVTNLQADCYFELLIQYLVSMNGCCALHNNALRTNSSKLLLHTRPRVANQAMGLLTDEVGNLLICVFHKLTIYGIGAATVWTAMHAFF